MGDVGIGGVGGVKGDDSGSIEVLHLLEVRQTDIVYQIVSIANDGHVGGTCSERANTT